MAQTIKQGSLFGRIGSGAGQGLAEQLPKDMERGRLASGLQNLAQNSENLTPMQQQLQLFSIPGTTPQMQQSFTELAKINNQANAYRNRGGYRTDNAQNVQGQPQPPNASPNGVASPNAGASMPMQQGDQGVAGGRMQGRTAPQQEQVRNPNENTLNPDAKTRLPWTPQQRDASVVSYLDKGFLPDQAQQLAANDEARDLGQAPVIAQRQKQDMERAKDVRAEMDRQLDTKLQKKGDDQLKDLIGEAKIKTERAILKALRNNADLSIEDAVNYFSDKALDTAKAKVKLSTLSNTTGSEALLKGNDISSKLDDYSSKFKESGDSEEYYNTLKKDLGKGGFGLSSEGAATKAFPMNPTWKSYVKEYNPQNMKQTKYGVVPDPKRMEANARKAANDVVKNIGDNDSVLTIGRELRKKDAYFDQDAFYDEMRLIQKEAGLNERQVNELPERNTDWLPTWGDFLILPWGNTR